MPHGIKLWDKIFKNMDYRDYSIAIINGDEHVTCTAAQLGRVSKECYFLVVPIWILSLVAVPVEVQMWMKFHFIIWLRLCRALMLKVLLPSIPCQVGGWRRCGATNIHRVQNMESWKWAPLLPSITHQTHHGGIAKRTKSPLELIMQKKANVLVQHQMALESKKAAEMTVEKSSDKNWQIERVWRVLHWPEMDIGLLSGYYVSNDYLLNVLLNELFFIVGRIILKLFGLY